MLDTGNIHSADIVAASRQQDIILQLCKVLTLNGHAAGRQYTLRIMQPCFAALRWLNAERFNGSATIDSAISELQASAAQLAQMLTADPPPSGRYPKERCPACGAPSVAPFEYSPTAYCSACLNLIMPSLQKLRSWNGGFGTDAI